MDKIANLSVAEAKTLRLLERKRGADVDTICHKLDLAERQARSIIDRLRRKGVQVERTGKCKFHVEHAIAEILKPAARRKEREARQSA